MVGRRDDVPPVRRVRWSSAFRIIPTRYPPVQLFERLADPSEWETLAEIESLTNARVRDELGDLRAVAVEDRVTGPGASFVMAPFVHRRTSRFSDGTFGVYYCASRRQTAVAETVWHMGRFYRATAEPPLAVEMRVLIGAVDDRLHDLRASSARWAAELSPDDYARSQQLGVRLRRGGSRGIVYPSVRHAGGTCVAAFTPRAVGTPDPAGVLSYHWNGTRIDRVFDYASASWWSV